MLFALFNGVSYSGGKSEILRHAPFCGTNHIASFIICCPLHIVGHQLSAKFTEVTRYDNEFTEYRQLTRNCSCSFVFRYSALVFSLASLLDMPARTKKAEISGGRERRKFRPQTGPRS